jgi:membrane peptidoglycan carboxypeptidase
MALGSLQKSMDKRSRRTSRTTNRMTTRSGRVLKVNQSLGSRIGALKQAKSLRKVQRMRGLPKSRVKRFIWRLNPRKQAEFWFSRDGGIMALKIAGIGILLMFVMTLGVFAYFRKDLPQVKDISGGNLGGSISYYDKTGQTLLWQDYNAVKRVPVKSNEIPQYLKDATVAVEDRDFYNHRGFDIKGIARAAFNDIIKHGSTQGGSTITQQLVKLNEDWTQQRTITRKVKELILAVELERTYTKDEILTGYLNAAPYGGVDHGVQAAASDYFHKSSKDLTLPESAMLAAIPKAPSTYSPYSGDYFSKTAFLAREHYILDVMAQRGSITKQQAEDAKKVDVLAEVQPRQTDKYAGIKSPYFVLAAKSELERRFTCTGGTASCNKVGGWKVITTMDLNLQTIAEQKVTANLKNAASAGADEQALAAEDVATGQMVALVGGTDFNDTDHGQINYAQTPIPPGSSFKPYDYVSLIDNTTNAGAGSVLYDVQQPLPGYQCTNKNSPKTDKNANCLWDYDFKYPGPLTLRYALGGSRNVPAVKAMLTVGTDKTIQTANALMASPGAYSCYGDEELTQKAPCYGASAIGDGAFLHLDQHVNGLASLARLGQAIPSTYILSLQNASGKTFYKWQQPKPKQVVRAEAAYIVDDMASDPNASYLPSGYYKFQRYKGWNIAVKTGTTNDNFDGLMTAWTTKYAVASWVGNHSRQVALRSAGMEFLTTPLTRGFITAALDAEGGTPVNWTQPAGIKKLPAYVVRNHVGVGSIEPSPTTDLFPSWYQPKAASNQSTTIDKVSNKQATTCTPTLAKQVTGGGAAPNTLSADIYYGATGATSSSSASANTSGSDDVHSCSDNPPSISSVFINGQDVTGGGDTTCDNGSCTITTTVTQGTHPLSDAQYAQFPGTVNLLVNGVVAQSKTVSDSPSSISFTYAGSGTASVAIQVIDSVLYDATSSTVAITFSATPAATTPPVGGHGGEGAICTPVNSKKCRDSLQQQGFLRIANYVTTAILFLPSKYLGLF